MTAGVLVIAFIVAGRLAGGNGPSDSSGFQGAGAPAGGPSGRSGDEVAPTRGDRSGFDPLAVGAGGFVTGISFSDDGATRVVRTDTYGGYRWEGDAWELNVSSGSLPPSDVRPGSGDGVLAMSVAPSDASRVYMAYDDGVFTSNDAGRSWKRVLDGISTAPNDSFRTSGSRLAVDPRDADTVYYGTQADGLQFSRDGGRSWSEVPRDELPSGLLVDLSDERGRGDLDRPTIERDGMQLAGAGISSVAVDGSSATTGRSPVLYAASYGEGVFRSSDAGTTWSQVGPDEAREVSYLRVLSNGDVVLTARADPTDLKGDADVWRLRDRFQERLVMPAETSWKALAEDPGTPGLVAAMGPGGELALSDDFGDTWRKTSRAETSEGDVPWLAWALDGETDWMSVGEIAFDPVVPGRLWFAEGIGVWFADLEPGAEEVRWQSQSRGIEQLVPTGVIAPPGGRPVLTSWDRPIFRSEDPEAYPEEYGPTSDFSSAWSSDWSLGDPEYLVASVASHQWPSDPSRSGYSADGGRSWRPFPSIPLDSENAVETFGFGSIAVGEPGNVVWAPSYGKEPYFTTDGGASWDPVELPGADASAVNSKPYYVNRQVLASDKETPGTFYLYVLGDGLFATVDGGRTWDQRSDDAPFSGADMAWHVSLKAVPGEEGRMFMTPGQLGDATDQPFHRSDDGGRTWRTVDGVTGVTAFGFGKAMPGASHSSLYVAGHVEGRYGIYRSVDDARSWTFLTDYPAGRTSTVTAVDGDKDLAGRVYLALSGAGWAYGG